MMKIYKEFERLKEFQKRIVLVATGEFIVELYQKMGERKLKI